jgi:hypothetical protein
MIGVASTLLIAVLLLILLLLLGTKGASSARQLSSTALRGEDAAEFAPCPPEFVSKIFSRADWEFVTETKSPLLEDLLRRERKQVALFWIQQTSAAIQRIMREHAQVSRESDTLEFTTEMKLVFQYTELMLICGMLFVAIQSAGPLRLRRLALYADSLAQRIAQAQLALQSATAARNLEPS